jgi:two-component system sensor histidine kinase KdpD
MKSLRFFTALPQPHSPPARMLWAVAACALATLLAWPWRDLLDPANTAMLYLLAVAVVAARAGKGAAIAAALLGTALLDFFFIQPRFTFSVGDVQYVVTLAVMFAVALIIGNLTQGLQREKEAAQERERQSRALYQLASQLAGALTLEQIDEMTRRFLHETQSCRGLLLMRHGEDVLPVSANQTPLSGKPSYAAQAALQQGAAQATLDGALHWLILPLHDTPQARGVLALSSFDVGLLGNERRPLFKAIAALVAASAERLHFVEVAQQTQLQMTDERLRSSILSALSHDIRTPLTVLYGMADSLAQAALPDALHEMADAMRQQTLRLNSMVSNLLDMAKLRAGDIRLNLEWQPVEEVIGASIKLLGAALARHPVSVALAPDMPLLRFDAVLMERVLCNLLENAAKYAPPGSPIRIEARTDKKLAHISVSNDGSQFPPDRLENLFELFERGDTESNIPGVGLGLAICRSIVTAHGGSIHADNDNGARVTFTLPLGEPPEIEPEEA